MLDITDSGRIESALRERNEALEAADRLKSAFVANMSYELRTPLTSILGFSEMLTGGYAGDLNGQQGEYMRAILESADRLQGRSEEHTSALQSLMRISYAVFCLKKNHEYKKHKHTSHLR